MRRARLAFAFPVGNGRAISVVVMDFADLHSAEFASKVVVP